MRLLYYFFDTWHWLQWLDDAEVGNDVIVRFPLVLLSFCWHCWWCDDVMESQYYSTTSTTTSTTSSSRNEKWNSILIHFVKCCSSCCKANTDWSRGWMMSISLLDGLFDILSVAQLRILLVLPASTSRKTKVQAPEENKLKHQNWRFDAKCEAYEYGRYAYVRCDIFSWEKNSVRSQFAFITVH